MSQVSVGYKIDKDFSLHNLPDPLQGFVRWFPHEHSAENRVLIFGPDSWALQRNGGIGVPPVELEGGSLNRS